QRVREHERTRRKRRPRLAAQLTPGRGQEHEHRRDLHTAGGAGGAAVGGGGGGGAPGLTQFTRPASSFEPEGGRATGLKPGLLNPAEVRTGPVTGGGGMPAPAGMLGRGQGEEDKKAVQHARIVVAGNAVDDR
ncbi:MAG TPA: hypothetical protein PKI77_16190, partial [Mycobacterium sp.]|nr:hypothetical protein [Mycobacterium sp.]